MPLPPLPPLPEAPVETVDPLPALPAGPEVTLGPGLAVSSPPQPVTAAARKTRTIAELLAITHLIEENTIPAVARQVHRDVRDESDARKSKVAR